MNTGLENISILQKCKTGRIKKVHRIGTQILLSLAAPQRAGSVGSSCLQLLAWRRYSSLPSSSGFTVERPPPAGPVGLPGIDLIRNLDLKRAGSNACSKYSYCESPHLTVVRAWCCTAGIIAEPFAAFKREALGRQQCQHYSRGRCSWEAPCRIAHCGPPCLALNPDAPASVPESPIAPLLNTLTQSFANDVTTAEDGDDEPMPQSSSSRGWGRPGVLDTVCMATTAACSHTAPQNIPGP